MQAYKDLVKALPGLKEDMPRAFYMLAELFDYGSFDICRSDDKYIIPYIMNDAVECYLTMENAVLKGDYHSEEEIISASLVLGSEKGYGLILHQQDNVVTLWFDNLHAPLLLSLYPEMSYFMVFKACLMHMQIIKPECDHIVLLVQNESVAFFTS